MTKVPGRISFSYENPLQKKFHDEFFKQLPQTPGVYLMLDPSDSILYVGKAKSLRQRVMSYRNAKPGSAPENVIEMLGDVVRIKWETCETEARAHARELELIQAIRPPFNIAANWPASYFFIGVRFEKGRAHFRLTSREGEDGYRFFGCYRNRRLTKSAYSALLRLFYAAQTTKPRFSFPAKISRVSPPYVYSAAFRDEWAPSLRLFLSGKNRRLLRELTAALLENEHIQPFLYHVLQRDLAIAHEFYRQARGQGGRPIGHQQMDDMITKSLF